ncbi:MAG: ABC transporter substrate-binding protein [Chloroflexi bacterium]|nr:ABC transporter substrate-binding protein [Chloroflexota bacterium]
MAERVGRFVGFLRWALLVGSVLALVIAPATGGVAQSQQPRRGGTFVIALEGEPPTLNPYINTGTTVTMNTVNIYNFLVGMDFDFKPTPDLAESWEISSDQRSYTFKLVKNATWHDGKPVTSADVKFTMEELYAKNHPRAAILWKPNVDAVEAPDASTVVVRLKNPYAPFMTMLGMPGIGPFILPKHVYEGTDLKTNPANAQPIGSGPFKLKEWVKGSHIEMVRYDGYFKKDLPYLDRIVVRFAPDNAGRMAAFEKGEMDFIHYYIVPHDMVAQLKANPAVTVDPRGGEGPATSEFLLINLRNPTLAKLEVRQAIAYALDKEEIRKKALFGQGVTAHSVVHTGMKWAHNSDVTRYPVDQNKANELLDKAGFPKGADGTRFKLRLSWATGRSYEGLAAEVIRDQLRGVGIAVEIKTYDTAAFVDAIYQRWDFDLAHQLFTTGPDPTLSIPRFLHSKQIIKSSFVNAMGYTSPAVDKLLDEEYKQTDRSARAKMWRDIQDQVARDVPMLPLFELPIVNTYRSQFRNVVMGPFGIYENRERVWIDQPGAAGAAAETPVGVIVGVGAVAVVAALGAGWLVLRRRSTSGRTVR